MIRERGDKTQSKTFRLMDSLSGPLAPLMKRWVASTKGKDGPESLHFEGADIFASVREELLERIDSPCIICEEEATLC